MSGENRLTTDDGALLWEFEQRIQGARARAVLAVNAEQIALHHGIGRELLARREADGVLLLITRALPQPLDTSLPSIQALEDEVSRGLVEEES